MVRIFAAGDFHGDKNIARKLAEQSSKFDADLIVLNGDIVEEDNAGGVLYYFVKTGKPVFLVPGNHDWFITDFLAAKYGVQNIHGKSIRHGDVSIVGCGGAGFLSEKEIYDIIKKNSQSAHKSVLVTHVHSAGTLMESFSDFVRGSSGLRRAIEVTKPDVAVCGHVHEAEGIEEKLGSTIVINVGKKGRLIEL
ncbi:metallophosphoesterase family protein [Candidatus Woesearchaeota archaeon]|nr:metallophosphoesterase family protein [Candidatus Woesearchaeota archaeon]